jgi:hypothetical protein
MIFNGTGGNWTFEDSVTAVVDFTIIDGTVTGPDTCIGGVTREPWTEATSTAGWGNRYGHTSLDYNGKIWVLGGANQNDVEQNDVWYSTDGVTWTEATAAAGWALRRNHASVVYDGKMWVMGGYDYPSGSKNDVWYSTDGVTWTEATAAAGWDISSDHNAVVFDGKMWVVDTSGDGVWHSTDGANWTLATDNPGWVGRSGGSCVVYDGRMWVMGGYHDGNPSNDVWYSTDGVTWTQMTSEADWTPRYEHTSIVYDNKMWVLGGRPGATFYRNSEAWYSTDGITWIQDTSGPWSGRYTHASVVFDNRMWVMGGIGDDQSDVWSRTRSSCDTITVGGSWSNSGVFVHNDSNVIFHGTGAKDITAGGSDWAGLEVSNGTSTSADWVEVADHADWSVRHSHTSVVHDGKMWVMGGYSWAWKSDVWSSSDGRHWTQATADGGWPGRGYHSSLVYDGKMWVIGGYGSTFSNNDVWYSADGETWTEATSSAAWSERHFHSTVVYDGKMWVLGGWNATSGTYTNDVWYSTDGATWTEATSSADWSARMDHSAVVYDGKMWVMGGQADGGVLQNDVWYSTDGITWTVATSGAPWSARRGQACVVHDGKMWMSGGAGNDVWYSTDGITWIEDKADSSGVEWRRRKWHTSLSYDDNLWVMGGYINDTGQWDNDVWSTGATVVNFTDGFTCATFKSQMPRSTLYFAANETFTVTESGGLVLRGFEGDLIKLMRYGGSGLDQWSIDPQGGSWDVGYVDVSNSNNLHASSIDPDNSADSGNNTNWLGGLPPDPSTPTYIKVTGTGTMTAGGSQQVALTVYDQYGAVATDYSGDKALTFSGANPSPDPVTSPTCTDKSSSDISFGSATVLTFAGGVATSTMKLNKAETVHIDVSDGTIASTGDDAHDLDVTVIAGGNHKLLWDVQPSSPQTTNEVWAPFSIGITDQYGNRTSSVNTVTITPSAGTFGGSAGKAAVAGLATFDDITYDTTSTITVTGTASELTDTPASQNVVVQIPVYTISGSVGTLDGVTMNGLPGSPVTSGGGFYSAAVDEGWSGTVTPEKEGCTFDPANRAYSDVTSDQLGQDYTPTIHSCPVSGSVGTLDGVTMNGLPGNPLTSGGGFYTAMVDCGWSGTVTPVKDGYTFDPANRIYSSVCLDQLGQDYTPTLNTYTVSGSVGTVDGVTMNGLPGDPVTSGGGFYSAAVNHGWSGTVTPTKNGCSVDPVNRTYANVVSDQLNQDYNPTIFTLSMAVSGTGSTTPTVGDYVYDCTTPVSICAVNNGEWQFYSWTGDVADPYSACTTVALDGDKTVTANFTVNIGSGDDIPHVTHLSDPKGPGITDCGTCHIGPPAYHNVDANACDACHSPDGAFDKDTHPDLWVWNNWHNLNDPAGADYSMIYDVSPLRSGKEKWCVTCHDQDAPVTSIQIDDFETYADDAALQAVWTNNFDARVPLLEASGGPDVSQCVNVRVKWIKDATYDYGVIKRLYDPYIDLTDMDYVNFYVKIDDPTKFDRIKVRLAKYPSGDLCAATFEASELGSGVWRLVSLPRSSFNDTTWGQVSAIQFRIFELSGGSDYEESVYIDNVYFTKINPLSGGGGPNVVGDNQTYGYFITGHNFGNCTWCHDPASDHIDGESLPVLEYIKNTANPTNFRFYADPGKQMRLPYNAGNTSVYNNQDFALCYWCHSETGLVGDDWGDGTNFLDKNPNSCGLQKNLHYLHVKHFADDQWPLSCVHCHDPHGQSYAVMTRKEMGRAVIIDANGCEILPGADTDGDYIEDRFDPDVNMGLALQGSMIGIVDGPTCDPCHFTYKVKQTNEPPCDPGYNPYTLEGCLDAFYLRTYEILPHTGGMEVGPDCFTAGCHTVIQNHATHFVNVNGPRLPQDETGCNECHADGTEQCAGAPWFWDNKPLEETQVCGLVCHISAGP